MRRRLSWRLCALLLAVVPLQTARSDCRLIVASSKQIHYLPDETARFTGTLVNDGTADASVEVTCRLIRRLNEQVPVGTVSKTEAAKDTVEVAFDWPIDGVCYGYELQMEIPGQEAVSDWFGVSANVVEIGIQGASDFANYQDVFAWAPDDFGDLTPDSEHWWSGQGNYDYTRTMLRERMERWHERGIKVFTYAKGVSGGPPGMDLLIANPDWACYNRFGQLGGLDMAFDLWALKNWNVNEHRTADNEFWRFWHCWTVNFSNEEAVIHGARALVEGAEMFGWDGARFDAGFDVFGGWGIDGDPTDRGQSRDELNVRNLRLAKDYILQRRPGYLFGYNYGTVQMPPTAMDRVVCEGGGLIMDEGITNTSDPQDPDNPWINFARRIIREVDAAGALGGCQIIFDFNRSGRPVIADTDYGLAFCFAGGGRPYGWRYRTTRYPLDRFATRYSEFLMNDAIHSVDNPNAVVSVASTRPVWWQDWVGLYEPEPGRRFYIVHLFNPPQTEGIGSTPWPQALENVSVTFTAPTGERVSEAWLLSPSPDVSAAPLAVTRTGTNASVTVATLDLWNMVVLTTEAAR